MPQEETDLSFADFGGPGRPYTAPVLESPDPNKIAPDLSGRGHSVLLKHETRFELAFPSAPAASHTRRSVIARVSPSRWQRVAIVEFIDLYQVYRA